MSDYFNRLPDFEYVSRLPDAKISDYIKVKNLFKKGIIREDIFQELAFFEKYQIEGDDRPDIVASKYYGDQNRDWLVLQSNNIINVQTEWPLSQRDFDRYCLEKYQIEGDDRPDIVASKYYGDQNRDWLVLQSNNIINVQTEWPLSQRDFDRYCLEKYGSYDNLYNGVHHYETVEIKNSNGVVIVPEKQQVPSDYTVRYYDDKLEQIITVNETTTITNYQYEDDIQTNKRNIFLLKPTYVPLVIEDHEDMMQYRKGSTQYVSETLKRADNIRLYD